MLQRKCGRILWGLMFWLGCDGAALADVVLSEIMFDPSGNDYHDEYVELYNTSEADPVDLAGWRVSDGSEADSIIPRDQGSVLRPGQFALILDASYFESSVAYDPLPPDALILTIDDASFGKGGWSNSTSEPVILMDAEGDTVAVYWYSLGNVAGHSDEKIFLAGDDGPENWGDCVSEGGTPGVINTLYVEELPSRVVLRVDPNPFEDRAVISYDLPQTTAMVNLWIYDRKGRRVRKLLDAAPSGSGRSEVWDGRDDDGRRLHTGIYVIYLEALNAGKGTIHRAKKPVVLARKL